MKKCCIFVILLLVLYIYIYNPIIKLWGGISSIVFLLPLLFLLFTNREMRFHYRKTRDLIWINIIIIIFTSIWFLFEGDYYYFRYSILNLITVNLLAIPIVVLINKSNNRLSNLLFYNGFVASIITLLCIIYPFFNDFVKDITIETTEFLKDGKNTFRGFGFATGLLYSYGLSLGIILSYCLYKGQGLTLKYLVLLPISLIAILVNAKTGFIIVLVSAIFYLLYYPQKGLSFILSFILFFSILTPLMTLSFLDPATLLVIENFFNLFFDVISSGEMSQNNQIFDLLNSIVLPSTIDGWLIGSGHTLFMGSKISSDIGFIQHLYYGGLVYTFLQLFMIYLLVRRISNRYWFVTCLAIFFIAHIKFDFVTNEGCFRLYYLIIIYDYISNMNIVRNCHIN